MAISLAVLAPSTPLPATATLLYTSPGGALHTLVKNGTFSNVTGTAASLTVYRVASGGTAGTTNELIPGISIAANSTYVSGELRDMILEPGDTIWALGSAANAINASLSGYTA
jgi:hypothetical protein